MWERIAEEAAVLGERLWNRPSWSVTPTSRGRLNDREYELTCLLERERPS